MIWFTYNEHELAYSVPHGRNNMKNWMISPFYVLRNVKVDFTEEFYFMLGNTAQQPITFIQGRYIILEYE